MNANERDEIAASVAAHAELGAGYDTAVAEGLVERIGEEIDKRIDARLGERQRPAANSPQPPPGYRGPTGPLPTMPVAAPPPAPRRTGGLSGVVLGLGSMGIGIGATAVIVGNKVDAVAAVLMVVLIWVAIAVVNIAHSQRKL